MNKVVPKIKNGDCVLLLSETFCFSPDKGLSITIPTGEPNSEKEAKDLVLNFSFIEAPGAQISSKYEAKGNSIEFLLTNFAHTLGAGTTSPFYFGFGDTQFSIFFLGKALINNADKSLRVIQMTVSIYEGKL